MLNGSKNPNAPRASADPGFPQWLSCATSSEIIMQPIPFEPDVVIVGAGIAGLSAAAELVASGRRVVVLEKSRGVGGRMATRRVGDAVCDHGAQFFTVRGEAFGGMVAEAHEAGSVAKWCEGFSQAASVDAAVTPATDGHARWRGMSGMTDLPKRLAAQLPPDRCVVQSAVKVVAIGLESGRVRISLDPSPEAGEPTTLHAAAAIVTSPVPQSLDLFAAGGLLSVDRGIASEVHKQFAIVTYDPSFALMLVLNRASLVPPPGGIQFAGGPISWLADNQQKGLSTGPALTVHASGAFSRQHFDDAPEQVAAALIDLVRPWIDGDPATGIVGQSLHRWKFATPTTIIPEPMVAAVTSPPIVCCGDAFGGPKVEGAASSGLAAGRWVARVLAGD
jgi:predicted NAD/FAD-dependent oxidoreductase